MLASPTNHLHFPSQQPVSVPSLGSPDVVTRKSLSEVAEPVEGDVVRIVKAIGAVVCRSDETYQVVTVKEPVGVLKADFALISHEVLILVDVEQNASAYPVYKVF